MFLNGVVAVWGAVLNGFHRRLDRKKRADLAVIALAEQSGALNNEGEDKS